MNRTERRPVAPLAIVIVAVALVAAIVFTLLVFFGVVLTASASGPSPVGSAPAGSGVSVNGVVRDAGSSAPVPSAELFVTGATSTVSFHADSAGEWSLLLPNGTYVITATAVSYGSDTANVTVAGRSVGPLVLTLGSASASSPAASGGGLAPGLAVLLPYLPSAAVGVAGYAGWRAFVRIPPMRGFSAQFR